MEHEHVFETAKSVGARYPRPLTDVARAQILNRVAYIHRDEGWGVSGKPTERHILHVDGETWIAEDILHHRPSNRLFDVIRGTDEAIVWQDKGEPVTPDRIWVAPVTPPEPPIDPPIEPPIDPPTNWQDVIHGLKTLTALVAQLARQEDASYAVLMDVLAQHAQRQEELTDLVVRRVAAEAAPLRDGIDQIRRRLFIRGEMEPGENRLSLAEDSGHDDPTR